jgi:phospholipid/cholesterol/gamma-HCH transport system permease protein
MQEQATISVEDNVIRCRGAWILPNLAQLERGSRALRWPNVSSVLYDVGGVTAMDTGGALMLLRCISDIRRKGQQTSLEGLKPEFTELLRRIETQWPPLERGGTVRPRRIRWTKALPQVVQARRASVLRALAFLGESTIAFGRSLIRPRSVRWRALLRIVESDGVRALPITGLLTFLVGVVIAYQGAEQLRKFGTNIFIVDLVGISLLREIAPLIVAILIAGRSGSAYAAEIGTMKVTEELDAIRTLGISPMNLLVLPRVVGLVIALPLLTMFADVVGVFGGMLIALGELNVSFVEFIDRFEEAVPLRQFLIGLGKAPFFAAIIALVGSYQGFQIRGGVDDVGRHTTISVVQGIFFVIVFDALCSILLNWWDL